jgi:hypothetical protein
MKRLMMLSVAIALCCATAVNADPFGTFTSEAGTESVVLNYARAAQTGALAGLDLITLTIGSISVDPDTSAVQKITGLSALDPPQVGTGGNALFHALGNGYMVVQLQDDGSGNMLPFTLKTPTAPGSYVNYGADGGFTGIVDSAVTLPPGYGADMVAYSTLSDTWLSTSASGNLAVNAILAKLYVPTGGNAELTGSLGMSVSGNGCLGHGTTFIPEPGTMVLLATGLMGLIAYAWRKRK